MDYADRGSFLKSHFSLRHRALAVVNRMTDNVTYTARRGLVKGLKRKGGLGFIPEWAIPGGTESKEVQFFRALDLEGKVVYDIGGFQGMLTLFFATRAKTVVVFEPHPQNRARLEENVALNRFGNVIVRPFGVGSAEATIEFVTDPRMMGGSSGEARLAKQIRGSGNAQITHVPIVRLDDEIPSAGLPLPDFMKIDIEGMELDALRGTRRLLSSRRPELFIEMHGATMPIKEENAVAVVNEIASMGYSQIAHIESGTKLTPETAKAAAEGHVWARA